MASPRTKDAPPRGLVALCAAIAIGVGVTAAVGIFGRGTGATNPVISELGEFYHMATDGVYRNNPERMVAEGVGWDIVTLALAVPAMLIALRFVARGSTRGTLVATGLPGYFFYQYLMYATGWAFGPLFLPFVAIYAASALAIVWLLLAVRALKSTG